MDGWNKLQFTSAGANQIKVENPSAFNLTFNKFYANGRDIEKREWFRQRLIEY